LARLLEESGLQVQLVQVNPAYPAKGIERLRGVRAAVRLLPYLARLWRCAGRVDVLHVMANSGWAWHLFAAPAIWVGRLRRVPVVLNYRGGEAAEFFSRQFRWVRPSIAKTSLVIVPSQFLKSIFAEYGINARIVPNIIDVNRFAPIERRNADVNIVVTRNLEKLYDIPTAISAFALIRDKYPNARLTIAGSGPERDELEGFCTACELGDCVQFTGSLDNASIADLYQSASLVLNPSSADNMPNSLLEAMACGIPIVSTNVGGIPYMVVDGETALLVSPGDPQAMAASAERILSDTALATRLKVNGRIATENCKWERVRPVLFDAYARAIGGNASGESARVVCRHGVASSGE
jgi:glycosyltransferase involved in cell wall biosynthesis